VLFKNLKTRSIGPAVMGGRVSDTAIDSRNPFVFYVGLGHGGVFKTNDNGVTFQPIFDKQPMLSIGAVAVAFSPTYAKPAASPRMGYDVSAPAAMASRPALVTRTPPMTNGVRRPSLPSARRSLQRQRRNLGQRRGIRLRRFVAERASSFPPADRPVFLIVFVGHRLLTGDVWIGESCAGRFHPVRR